ncbi:hypothetical protein [uncultured virus]|uniref:Uncharacterized protein n=1 Tax=uncultured virus TaxID=340016 RepID=A0A218MMS2_9VIRU|nr:hypothetical protein [uncultured virus]
MSETKVNIKKKVYESKKARDILDEEFIEFLPKKRSINEFFSVYSNKFYILLKETHNYFIETSLNYIQSWTHPTEILLQNIREEINVVQSEINATERFHPIIPNNVVLGIPIEDNTSDAPASWDNLYQCNLYYVQSGKIREIGKNGNRTLMFNAIKNKLRQTEILNSNFIIQVTNDLIDSMEKSVPILRNEDLNLTSYTINTTTVIQ